MTAEKQPRIQCFPPIAAIDARILILGSMPGRLSLERQQYYAHPRNAFWPIIGALFGAKADLPYEQRVQILIDNRIAVWDVLSDCVRSSSLDTDIDAASETANDFGEFLARHTAISMIAFNGGKAQQSFRNHCLTPLKTRLETIRLQRLPSTSPAHAAMSVEEKLQIWRSAILRKDL